MPITPPLADEQLPEASQAIMREVIDALGDDAHTAYRMFAHSPSVLRDGFENMRRFIKSDTRPDGSPNTLTLKQREAIALAASSANHCKSCVKAHSQQAQDAGWSDEEVAAILGLTAVTSAMNHHHRMRHLAPSLELPAESGLSFQTITTAGASAGQDGAESATLPRDITELIAIVASAINGCAFCVEHHIAAAKAAGVGIEQVRDAVYVGSAMTMFNVYFRTQ